MTRSELVEALAARERVPRETASAVVDTFFGTIAAALASGGRVEIRGFGSFQSRSYSGYTGRNPRTGASIDVAPKILPVFRVGAGLRLRLNPPAETYR